MKKPLHRHLDHQSPEWIGNDATFFVTICADPRGVNQLCQSTVGPEILRSIRHYHEKRKWFCHLAVLMPDHVHFLLSFPDVKTFSPIIGDWKRWLTLRHKVSMAKEPFLIIEYGTRIMINGKRIIFCRTPCAPVWSSERKIGPMLGCRKASGRPFLVARDLRARAEGRPSPGGRRLPAAATSPTPSARAFGLSDERHAIVSP